MLLWELQLSCAAASWGRPPAASGLHCCAAQQALVRVLLLLVLHVRHGHVQPLLMLPQDECWGCKSALVRCDSQSADRWARQCGDHGMSVVSEQKACRPCFYSGFPLFPWFFPGWFGQICGRFKPGRRPGCRCNELSSLRIHMSTQLHGLPPSVEGHSAAMPSLALHAAFTTNCGRWVFTASACLLHSSMGATAPVRTACMLQGLACM
jgi:hypothetical protein